MNLYLSVKTSLRDMIVDYIEVELTNGETASLNWDESYIERTFDGFNAWYIRVCFGEEHADGRLADLRGMRLAMLGIYTEAPDGSRITINQMEFEEAGAFYCPDFLPYTVDEEACDHT